jgi:hypothetical protein
LAQAQTTPSLNIYGDLKEGEFVVASDSDINITWNAVGYVDGTCSIAGPDASTSFYRGGAVSNSIGIKTGPITKVSYYFLMCVKQGSGQVDNKIIKIIPSSVTPATSTNNQTSQTNNVASVPAPAQATGGSTQYNTNVLFLDNVNGRIGLGTNSPKRAIDLYGKDYASRSMGLNGTQIFYFPDAETNTTSFFVGDGGRKMVRAPGNEPTNLSTYYNTSVGIRSSTDLTTASYNTSVGFEAMNYTTTGSWNTGIGEAALVYNKDGWFNTALGVKALHNNISGRNNVGLGVLTLNNNKSGDGNVAVGDNTLFTTTKSYNTAIGMNALYFSEGSYDAALGSYSLFNKKEGSGNVGVGSLAGLEVVTAYNNTFLGYNTGRGLKNGSYNTFVGANIQNVPNNLNSNILIADGNGTVRIQANENGKLKLSGYGAGNLVTDASGNVTNSSDMRLKNLKGNFSKGVEVIRGLNPIVYSWKENTGLDSKNNYVGFLAQDVQSVLPEAVSQDAKGFLSLSDRPIIAVIINSIKELLSSDSTQDKKIKELEEKIKVLENKINSK